MYSVMEIGGRRSVVKVPCLACDLYSISLHTCSPGCCVHLECQEMGRCYTCRLPLRSKGWVLSKMTGMMTANNNTSLWAYENILWDFPHLSFLLLCSLNLPACLPDTYIHMKDSQPVNRKESRKYSMVNREHICKNINCAEVDSDQYIDLSVQVLILGNYVNTCISRLWDTCHRCCFLLWWWGLFFFVGLFSQSFISHVLVYAAPPLHPPS